MAIPISQMWTVSTYVLKKKLTGVKRYPLVLMLEPLFRCNLACAGCGKIDYPDEILNQRMSFDQCMESIDECGAPAVSIAGGEPLLHRDMPRIVEGYIARKKFVILCTNALLLTKKIDDYKPSPYFTWSIHLDGDKAMHDKSVCLDGVYDKAVEAVLARVEQATGRYPEAAAAWSKTVSFYPHRNEFAFHEAECLFYSGRRDEAAGRLRALAAADPPYWPAIDFLTDDALSRGDRQPPASFWNQTS